MRTMNVPAGNKLAIGAGILILGATALISIEAFLFAAMVLSTAVAIYFSIRTHTLVDFAPIESFGILIAYYYGPLYALLYIALSNALPFLAGGDMPEFPTYIFLALLLITAAASTFFIEEQVLLGALFFMLIYQVLAFITGGLLFGWGRAALQTIGEIFVQSAYLLILGRVIIFLLS